MNKLKRFIALTAAFCMFSVSAYAETKKCFVQSHC